MTKNIEKSKLASAAAGLSRVRSELLYRVVQARSSRVNLSRLNKNGISANEGFLDFLKNQYEVDFKISQR